MAAALAGVAAHGKGVIIGAIAPGPFSAEAAAGLAKKML
jgi:hypothetical protein